MDGELGPVDESSENALRTGQQPGQLGASESQFPAEGRDSSWVVEVDMADVTQRQWF